MLFVRVVSFEQIYFVCHTLPDLLFVKPTGKISVMLPAPCYDKIGTYWYEVFPSKRALWAVFISACKELCTCKARWSHLHLVVQGRLCQDVTGQRYVIYGIKSLAELLPVPVHIRSQSWVESSTIWATQVHAAFTIPVFLSIPGFSMYLLHLHMMTLEYFFSFLNGNRGSAEGLHCGITIHGDFWFTSLPFSHQTLSHREMLLVVHAILSSTHQY